MTVTALTRRLILALLLITALGACGDDSVFDQTPVTEPPTSGGTLDPLAPGVTGTVPLPGPADWLEWTPAEAPDAAAEAELVAALEELGLAMIIPTSPPPTGGTTTATFNSQAYGWGSGETFADTAQISLNITREAPNFVIVSVPSGTPCPHGAVTLTFRGDDAACAFTGAEDSVVWWQEAGHTFQASFDPGLTLDQGLAWLETWRLLP